MSFAAERGSVPRWWGNGPAKSTLLKTVAGLLVYAGELRLDGRDAGGLGRRERARRAGATALGPGGAPCRCTRWWLRVASRTAICVRPSAADQPGHQRAMDD
jgi:hypothetical protein